MTTPEPTERVQIEEYAVGLGRSIYRATGVTSFGYDGRTLAVDWSSDGAAEQAELARLDGTALAAWHKRPTDVPGAVGDWVRHQLDAWLISYQRDTVRVAGGES